MFMSLVVLTVTMAYVCVCVCVCVDKLELGFSMAFVRHGFMNSVLEERENCKFLAVTYVAKRFAV